MTKLEEMAEAYWNAFREGFAVAGGDARQYPKWDESNDPVKAETLRCMRHAVEMLHEPSATMISSASEMANAGILDDYEHIDDDRLQLIWHTMLASAFPDKPQRRKVRLTATEQRFVDKLA